MPSKLIGVFPPRLLTWNDFNGTATREELQELQRVAASVAGQKVVGSAMVRSSFTVEYGGNPSTEPVVTAAPGNSKAFTLSDSITVKATFDGGFKNIAPLSAKGQEFLLDHEQGHLDITALMARDCFIDLMQLKAKVFSSQAEGRQAAKDVEAEYKRKLIAVQKTYDKDTTHGAWVNTGMAGMLSDRKESFQNKWEGFIVRARTVERTPPMSAPDGATYKRRLLDVLDEGGFVFKP